MIGKQKTSPMLLHPGEFEVLLTKSTVQHHLKIIHVRAAIPLKIASVIPVATHVSVN